MSSYFDFSERYGSRAGGYRDLMSHQVRHVLLVSSLYESFILAEDGHLHERVLGKFLDASPREPPDLTRVSSGREALKMLRGGHRRVDLVITSPDLGDMNALQLAATMADEGIKVPVTLLAYDRDELRAVEERLDDTGILASFLYQGDARILMAIVQAVEDRLNVERDTRIGVPVFLVVEDNVRFYSAFLPVIYSEVHNLSESVQFEAGNRLQRIMRMRARPKIIMATTYERALRDFQRYRTSIMGVFSDMQFPRGGEPDPDAGQALVRAIRALEPEVPISLQSSHEENRAIAEELDVGFLLKGSPDFLQQLRRYLSEHLFFGDFVFRDEAGDELERATDLKALVAKLKTIPGESVSYHALRHDFSRWLRARAEFGLAAQLRPRLLDDFPTVEALRDSLIHDIDRYRRERNRGSVNPFRAEFFDGEEGIVQIGGGSLGGKGRGLAFASRLLDEVRLSERFPGVRIDVPAAVVLGTGVFDEFLDDNDLRSFALQSEDDAETLGADSRGAVARTRGGGAREGRERRDEPDRRALLLPPGGLAPAAAGRDLRHMDPPQRRGGRRGPAPPVGGCGQARVRDHLRSEGARLHQRDALSPRGGGDGGHHPAGGGCPPRQPLLPAHRRRGPLAQLLPAATGPPRGRHRRRRARAGEDGGGGGAMPPLRAPAPRTHPRPFIGGGDAGERAAGVLGVAPGRSRRRRRGGPRTGPSCAARCATPRRTARSRRSPPPFRPRTTPSTTGSADGACAWSPSRPC